MSTMRLHIPAQVAVRARHLQNPIIQLRRGERLVPVSTTAWARRVVTGALAELGNGDGAILLVPREITPPNNVANVLVVPPEVIAAATNGDEVVDAGCGRWLLPRKESAPLETSAWSARRAAARESWKGQFQFKAEVRAGDTIVPGLRPPQIGALHALLAHWTITTSDPATIVMPTGTGKTQTMLAMLVATRPECLLVIVPTDALREQLANKFMGFGLLQQFGVIGPHAVPPVVGMLRRRPTTPEEVHDIFSRCPDSSPHISDAAG